MHVLASIKRCCFNQANSQLSTLFSRLIAGQSKLAARAEKYNKIEFSYITMQNEVCYFNGKPYQIVRTSGEHIRHPEINEIKNPLFQFCA